MKKKERKKQKKKANTYNGKKCPHGIFSGCNHIVTSAQVRSASDQDAVAVIYGTLTSPDAHFCFLSFFFNSKKEIEREDENQQLLL